MNKHEKDTMNNGKDGILKTGRMEYWKIGILGKQKLFIGRIEDWKNEWNGGRMERMEY